MLRGEDEHTMDEKGRVFLPVRHREELGPIVLVGRGKDGQINVYPRSVWDDMAGRVADAGPDRTTIRNTSRLLFSVTECEVDRQGRIVIPPLLRRYAGLGSDVVILGHNDRVEIWSRDRWQETCERILASEQDAPEDSAKVVELALNL